jgi:aspartyl-tRNA(Asn)/glutamyl-tRNA(Gln) amidotransferase subunit A
MGPLARTSRDCAHVLNAIAGPDQRDPYSAPYLWEPLSIPAKPSLEGLRIGWSDKFFFDNVDPEIRTSTESALRAFHEWGATIVELDLGWLDDVVALSHVILPAEACSALDPYLHRREDFGSEVLPLFEAGRLIPAYEYLQAQRLRRLYRDRAQSQIWANVDLLLGPSTAITAPRIGETSVALPGGGPVEVRAASTRLVRAFNVLGNPAHSFVAGFHSNGLPMSLQLVGAAFGEASVLAAAIRFEEELNLHRRMPPESGFTV